MQISDMKALRAISVHKRVFTPKTLPNPLRVPSKPLRSSTLSRRFHATSFSREAPKVWTVFDPLSGRTSTQRVQNDAAQEEVDKPEASAGSSDSSDGEERTYGGARKVKAFSIGDFFGNKKKVGKVRSVWVCSGCGYSDGQWWGMCRSCGASGTMTEFSGGAVPKLGGGGGGFSMGSEKAGSWLPKKDDQVLPVRLKDVNRGGVGEWRIPL